MLFRRRCEPVVRASSSGKRIAPSLREKRSFRLFSVFTSRPQLFCIKNRAKFVVAAAVHRSNRRCRSRAPCPHHAMCSRRRHEQPPMITGRRFSLKVRPSILIRMYILNIPGVDNDKEDPGAAQGTSSVFMNFWCPQHVCRLLVYRSCR